MINLLFEDEFFTNVFKFNPKKKTSNQFYNTKLKRMCSYELSLLSDINIVNPEDNVDFFVYPIFLNEPYFHIRHFSNPDHETFGIMNLIDEQVASKINQGLGVVYITMNYEPPNYKELCAVCSSLKNDRRFIFNIPYPELTDQNIVCLPGHLEAVQCTSNPSDRPLNFFDDQSVGVSEYKDFVLLNMRSDKHIAASMTIFYLDNLDLLKKGHCSFNSDMVEAFKIAKNGRYSESLFNNFTPYNIENSSKSMILLDAMKNSFLNVVIEAYYEHLSLDRPFITEKTWRNVYWDKPFILIGQRNSLIKFKAFGYKTFHPYINEAYDIMPDEERLFNALSELVRIVKMSNEEKVSLHKSLKPIFKHNKNNFNRRLQSLNDLLENVRYQ